jgi:hypothetical protein
MGKFTQKGRLQKWGSLPRYGIEENRAIDVYFLIIKVFL